MSKEEVQWAHNIKSWADNGAKSAFAVPSLIQALSDPDIAVRIRAANALGNIGPAAQPAESALRQMFQNTDLDMRVFAVAALSKIGIESPDTIKPQPKPADSIIASRELGGSSSGLGQNDVGAE